MKVVAIVQARMGSNRLPGKVMLDLAGQPVLVRVVDRLSRSAKINQIVIATTNKTEEKNIIDLCKENHWAFYQGSEDDLLDRYYQSAIQFDGDVIVRITSDCPLIDPDIVDTVIMEYIEHLPNIDYVSNFSPSRTYPRGLDTEVFSFDVLKKAWQKDKNPIWREHATPYIRNHPDLFSSACVSNEIDYSHMRWTVDTEEDLNFVRHIFTHFGNTIFSWLDVIALLENHPEWTEINKDIHQKTI